VSVHDLIVDEVIRRRLRCPDCHSHFVATDAVKEPTGAELRCSACGATFPVYENRPVLLRHDNAVFPVEAYGPASRPRGPALTTRLARLVPSPSVSLSGRRNLETFARLLAPFPTAHVLVLGAGNQRKRLEGAFRTFANLRLVLTDVDLHAIVDMYCDAHELPFDSGTFQGVIATAALEHVLYPEKAVAEIYRVLVDGGAVFSEIPFLQQVHEGAYDFTRYTLSGHRRLFNAFVEVESGMVAGPATALAWAIEHFALALVPVSALRNVVKASVRVALFWLPYLDYLLRRSPAAMDGASCTFFIGLRQPDRRTADVAIVERYVGANRLRHV
jgi:predicted Zn finger-like uncharacterized protein